MRLFLALPCCTLELQRRLLENPLNSSSLVRVPASTSVRDVQSIVSASHHASSLFCIFGIQTPACRCWRRVTTRE